MGRKFEEVSEVEFKKALLIMKKYLKENGCIKKPFHFSHYILSNANIGDYLIRVVYEKSETIKTNKLYKIVSGYSNRRYDNRTYWIIIDERGKEYEVDSNNYRQNWAYFPPEKVEKKYMQDLPEYIIEYNKKLAKIEKNEKERKRRSIWSSI